MIVPEYWAEARLKKRINGRQVTVKRFGWSDDSQQMAQQHAEDRADEAMQLVVAGKKINRHEPKMPYNGAEGVPIREEIIERHKDAVITRNSYGALCLNTPDVLFADVDFEAEPACRFYMLIFLLLIAASAATGFHLHSWKVFAGMAFGSLFFTSVVSSVIFKLSIFISGGARRRAKRRIKRFSRKHPDWHLRVYRTPAGYRVLVMHKTFAANNKETLDFFHALNTDPIYIKMCQKQRCFRARISPKPWRVGIEAHMKPRPGVWPIKPDRMKDRIAWVEKYEKAARQYASCLFEESLGSHAIDPKAEHIRTVHDRHCKSSSRLEIA